MKSRKEKDPHQHGKSMKAKIEQIMFYYDEPQLVRLLSHDNTNVIAVAVFRDGMTNPYFAVIIDNSLWKDYLQEKVDLRHLFENPIDGNYYFFDWNRQDKDGFVDLVPASNEEAKNPEYWLGQGFYSVDHNYT